MSQTPAVHIEIFQVASAVSLTSPELSEGIPAGRLPPSDWPMGLSVGILLFLITDGYGRPSLLGTVPPGQVVLGCLIKLAEQEPDEQTNRQHFSGVSASRSSEFLP